MKRVRFAAFGTAPAQSPDHRPQGSAAGVGEAPRTASPCVNVCRMDESSGYCAGCWRTIEEIAGWSSMEPAEREAVWQALDARRAAGAAPAWP